LINTQLGKYNILFNDVQVIDSTIGSHTYIQKCSTVFNANIGKFCSIASNVSIGPGAHKLDGISTHPVFYLKNTPLLKKYSDGDYFVSQKKTTIGHDVWIGEKAIIMDGVTVGTGAVVASGAVVTKDVAPYTIVGGVPAKVLRTRFTPFEIDEILKSEWWDKDEKWLEQNYKSFDNISDFIKIKNG
jgi:acetyltransferase-like isoleucine patch superfamily enzyme